MSTHLLVTNDFPPKIGGIQSLLWEWWRRLPSDSFVVLTTSYAGADVWDRTQPYRVERTSSSVLLPTPGLVRHIDRLAADIGADVVLLDPALPLGLCGPRLERPFGLVLHGAEVTVPGRLPGSRQLLGHVLRQATHVIAAGGYPATEAERAAGRPLPITVIPCGVDVERFRPIDGAQRAATRARWGVADDVPLIVSVSRLVPRKGMDVLIDAAARLRSDLPGLRVLIGGSGRDRDRLAKRIAASSAPVDLVGRVDDAELPAFYGCADVYAMLCRNRWAGLEQEGFGIVFLEAAACGTPQVAGRSGGADEAVVDGETGLVVDEPDDVDTVASALHALLTDRPRRDAMGTAGRLRAVEEFTYDVLSARLGQTIAQISASLR